MENEREIKGGMEMIKKKWEIYEMTKKRRDEELCRRKECRKRKENRG